MCQNEKRIHRRSTLFTLLVCQRGREPHQMLDPESDTNPFQRAPLASRADAPSRPRSGHLLPVPANAQRRHSSKLSRNCKCLASYVDLVLMG
jgi:hypothetical protein